MHSPGRPELLLAPDVLHASRTVDRLVGDEVLHVRPHCEIVESPVQPGPDGRLLQLRLDLVDQRETLLGIQLLRLLIDEPGDLVVAIACVVPGRLAAEELVEVGVRVVRLDAVAIGADLKLPARLQRIPAIRPVLDWRLDYFTVWPHVKNLVPHQSIYGW